MTHKELLIQAFKALDFKALNNLLDDDRPYMDVSKELFLSTLKQEVQKYKELKSFEEVVEGVCGYCHKGCKAYKFKAKNLSSLSLFFEEENEKVTDVYLCNALEEDVPDENDWNINFKFYDDEKVNFKPTFEYLLNLQKIEKAVEEFNNLEKMGLVPIEEIVYWYNKHEDLAKKLHLNDPFIRGIEYKAYEHLSFLYHMVSKLIFNINKNHRAKTILEEYSKINKNDERGIVKWLLKYENDSFYSFLKETDNWEKTGILILETTPNLVVDCSDCLDSFMLCDIYNKLHDAIMEKYKPTKAYFTQNGGVAEYSLKTYLKSHNKYLDLIGGNNP